MVHYMDKTIGRVVANWKGRIKPGAVIDSLTDFADVLPTIADGTGSKVPGASAVNGYY